MPGEFDPTVESLHGIWQQRNLSRPLDGNGDLALMPCAIPGNPARKNLPAFGQILRKPVCLLEIHHSHFIDTELTDAFPLAASSFARHNHTPPDINSFIF